ncbi:hypothetical protein, partial [Gottfriedia acidiceleris]|uniref:hypothetical protein n=1 Tax=Gottfriedia acidiceleris TaxID=371036 RepID=UPI003000E920
KGIIVLLAIVVIILAANFPKILNFYSERTAQKTKEVTMITKKVNLNKMISIESSQIQLSKKYDTRKTEWLYDEIHDGARAMVDHTAYLSHNPDYDSVKIQFSLVKYKIDGKTVEFLTNGKIIQVHSASGWKDK